MESEDLKKKKEKKKELLICEIRTFDLECLEKLEQITYSASYASDFNGIVCVRKVIIRF